MDKPSIRGTGTRADYTRAVAGAQFASPIPPGRVNARPFANREAQIAHDADRRGEGRACDTPSVDCTAYPGGVAIRCLPDFASGVAYQPTRQRHAQRKTRWRKSHPTTATLFQATLPAAVSVGHLTTPLARHVRVSVASAIV